MNSNNPSPNLQQQLQQRVFVREQEINALKVQNRHLLEKLDDLEKDARPNQINTQFVADEVQKHLSPVIDQLQSTITNSFEILQSTLRGIYQQSQRSQQAVEEMTAYSRDLEIRMNEQRKADQNFYQDKIFSMIGAFCDRLERQIEIRFKALSSIELVNSKQNEILNDVERMRTAMDSMSKNSVDLNDRMNGVQIHTRYGKEMAQDLLQQMQNHRAEFKLVRMELKSAIDFINRSTMAGDENEIESIENVPVLVQAAAAVINNASAKANAAANAQAKTDGANLNINPIGEIESIEAGNFHEVEAADDAADEAEAINQNKILNELIDKKHRELETLEKNIEYHSQGGAQDDATMILSLLRAQKNELQRVSLEAKQYLKEYQGQGNVKDISRANDEQTAR